MPDFYMRKACASWAHYDFKPILSEMTNLQTLAAAAGRKCPVGVAGQLNAKVAFYPRIMNAQIDAVKKLCAATGNTW
jgi:hypothetical protein